MLILRQLPYFQQPEQKRSNCRRGTLPSDIRLALTLQILATAEFVHVSMSFKAGHSMTYTNSHKMVSVLDKELSFPKFPKSEEFVHGIARDFKTSIRQKCLLEECVGALDGICIKNSKPDRRSNPALFNLFTPGLLLSDDLPRLLPLFLHSLY